MIDTYTTAVQIMEEYWECKVNNKIYDIYQASDKACKLQLVIAVEYYSTRKLYNYHISYTSTTTRELIDHMWVAYVKTDNN